MVLLVLEDIQKNLVEFTSGLNIPRFITPKKTCIYEEKELTSWVTSWQSRSKTSADVGFPTQESCINTLVQMSSCLDGQL